MNAITKFTKENIVLETFPVGPLQVNCTIIYCERSHEALVIDPGQDESILYYNNNRDLKINLLIHTHAHYDHIGITSSLKEQFKSQVLIFKDELPIYNSLPLQGELFNLSIPAPAPPDLLMTPNQTLDFKTSERTISSLLKVFHTPGHTIGSCCFYTDFFEVPILFAGDTLFKESVGRTDLPTGDYNQIKKSITEKLFSLPDNTHVIPGHGPNTTIGHEKEYNAFFGNNATI